VCFHGGFDFAYFLRMLLNHDLPNEENEFLEVLKLYFPHYTDLKQLVIEHEDFKSGGLSKLAHGL
jgi:CCR4-NOT transcription complex subunit 7/8